jgi:hypothetical protein
MKATVQVVSQEICREQYQSSGSIRGLAQGITDELICAKDEATRADTCRGSSFFIRNHLKNAFFLQAIPVQRSNWRTRTCRKSSSLSESPHSEFHAVNHYQGSTLESTAISIGSKILPGLE